MKVKIGDIGSETSFFEFSKKSSTNSLSIITVKLKIGTNIYLERNFAAYQKQVGTGSDKPSKRNVLETPKDEIYKSNDGIFTKFEEDLKYLEKEFSSKIPI
jgi:hypothetical protein